MVHITNKQKYVETGVLGIPTIHDCDGRLSRADWDGIVRKDAESAKDVEAQRAEERRRVQLEQAAFLQKQIEEKKVAQQRERQLNRELGSTLIAEDMDTLQTIESRERFLRSIHKGYLNRCHEVSVASTNIRALTPRKDVLQNGSNVMPFLKPSEEQRKQYETSIRRERSDALVKHRQESGEQSAAGVKQQRWAEQSSEYARELSEIQRQEARRLDEENRKRELADLRAARAEAVAQPQCKSPRVLPPSPRREQTVQYVDRRTYQVALRHGLEEQLAAQSLIQQQKAREKEADKLRMESLAKFLEASKKKDLEEKSQKQAAYREALLTQQRNRRPEEKGFLPEVAVNPFRGTLSPRRAVQQVSSSR